WVQQLQVSFFAPGTTATLLPVATPVTDQNGNFSVGNIPPGAYDVRVKHREGLSRQANGLVFLAGIPVGRNFGQLSTGDSDNNDLIDIVDFSQLRAAFGTPQTCGSAVPNTVPCADYDGNNQ